MPANWYECQPDFFIPTTLDCSRFPPYEDFDLELPDWTDVINIDGLGRPPSWAWAAWFNAQRRDAPLRIDAGLIEQVAARVYSSQRMVHTIPRWRRQLIEWVTEIDDIEDQISTIAWLAETVLNKIIPIPRGVLSQVTQLRRMLDTLENTLGLTSFSRASKAEFAAKQRELRAAKRGARTGLARTVTWLRENWGNLLEAGQATNTWFDVGIVLGPIMGYLENGLWDLAERGLDGYLIAADALMPGFRDDYYNSWADWQLAIDDAWAATFDTIDEWSTDAFTREGDPFDPYQEFTP